MCISRRCDCHITDSSALCKGNSVTCNSAGGGCGRVSQSRAGPGSGIYGDYILVSDADIGGTF